MAHLVERAETWWRSIRSLIYSCGQHVALLLDISKMMPDICKRDFIYNTIDNIQSATNCSRLRSACARLQKRLCYTAPELMDVRWNDLYAILCEMGTEDEGLQGIWRSASEIYTNKYSQFHTA